MEKLFKGKRALVVGGSGGIGRALALGLAERGAALTITGGSSQKRLETVLAELQGTQQIPAICGQMASHSGFLCPIGPGGFSPEEGTAFILERAGPPDIVVIAWGPFKKRPLPQTSPGDWRFLVESNLLFPGIMVSSVLGGMIKAGWGRILLFGGTNTGEIREFSHTAAYGAAKTALGVLAKSAAKSAGNAGITCNVICPGLVDTEYTGPEDRAYNQKKSPGGQALTPEETARFALTVLENPILNGALIPLDRGLRV